MQSSPLGAEIFSQLPHSYHLLWDKYKWFIALVYWGDAIGNTKGSFQMVFSGDFWDSWILDLIFFKYLP